MSENESPATRIAGDLAVAIHQGLLHPGDRVPSQTELMAAYGVAMATAASALAKVAAAGLTHATPGRGTFVADVHRTASPVLDVLEASRICRELASTTFHGSQPPTITVGSIPGWDHPDAPPSRRRPPPDVDATALAGLDRHLLRWLSEALLIAARQLVNTGPQDSNRHLMGTVQAILRHGGRRPDGQPPIAQNGGPAPDAEDVAFRLWPDRRHRTPGPDDPPF